MAADSRIPIILLKTISKPTDRYEEVLKEAEGGRYNPIFIPVLDHGLIDQALNEIEELVTSGAFFSRLPARKYGGIIFTSQRAVEAFARVVKKLRPKIDQYLNNQTVLYVVGPATQRALKAIDMPCPIKGEDTGNGDALAAYILDDYAVTSSEGTRLPLLFLVGEQRRDIIPRTLQSNSLSPSRRIRVDEITVYKTVENPEFHDLFKAELAKYTENQRRWVVVFSPSGCKTMLSVLGMLDGNTGKFIGQRHSLTKVATIGPTTRDYLMNEFAFSPDACAEKPTPDALNNSISTSDDRIP